MAEPAAASFSFTPAKAAANTWVTLSGSFTRETKVWLDGVGTLEMPIIRSELPGSIIVIVPEKASIGQHDVWIATGAAQVHAADKIDVGPLPVVKSVAPIELAPGDTVTITGRHLDEAAAVWFGAQAFNIVEAKDDRLVVRVPAGAKGKGVLVVESRGQKVDTAVIIKIAAPAAKISPPAAR